MSSEPFRFKSRRFPSVVICFNSKGLGLAETGTLDSIQGTASAAIGNQETDAMQFGITVDTHVSKWDLVRYAEELGYDRAWVPDSQMIWSGCYATLALAAVNTRRIQIGTGVSIPGTRIAPVTAHSIAMACIPKMPAN
jgi:hypothetical protein